MEIEWGEGLAAAVVYNHHLVVFGGVANRPEGAHQAFRVVEHRNQDTEMKVGRRVHGRNVREFLNPDFGGFEGLRGKGTVIGSLSH